MKTIVQLVTELKTYFLGKDTAAKQAVEANIAPVETDASAASQGYSAGAQLFLNDVLYDVIAPISANDALVVGTNIQAADDLSTQIAGAESGLANEAATRSAMGAKNILPFDLDEIKALNTAGTWASNVYSYRGVDFTVNPDGTILADGQATGGNASIKVFAASSSYEMLGKNVILNGCPSGGSATTYRIQAYRMGSADGSSGTYFDDGEGTIAFDALNNGSGTVGSFAVAVYENYDADNLLFKPMVRLSTDANSDYQPYAKTNKELTDDVSSLNQTLTNKVTDISDEIADMNNVLGAKNLLPNNAVTMTRDNVTYTVNLDKTVNVETGSGGASQQTGIMVNTKFSSLSAGDYILSDGESNGVQLYINCFDNNDTFIKQIAVCQNGAEVKFTVDYDGYTYMSIGFAILGGEEVNTICSPMIRPATIKDGTYEPYAMTNKEITDILTVPKYKDGFLVTDYQGNAQQYATQNDAVHIYELTNGLFLMSGLITITDTQDPGVIFQFPSSLKYNRSNRNIPSQMWGQIFNVTTGLGYTFRFNSYQFRNWGASIPAGTYSLNVIY